MTRFEESDFSFPSLLCDRISPWIFLSVLFTTLDAALRLGDLPFISGRARFFFLIEAHGIYLAATFCLGALAFLSARAVRTLLPTRVLIAKGKGLEQISLGLFLSLCLFSVAVRVTPVELGHWSDHDIAGLLLLGVLSLWVSSFLSRLLLSFRQRAPRAVWLLSLGLFLSGILLPPLMRPSPREKTLEAPSSPNVIIILVDALRADELGCYGGEATVSPNIDRFAKSAVLFSNATSSSSWTKTSIASLFSSLTPSHHGMLGERETLDDRVPLLASLLEERGYLTAAFVGNPWLAPMFGFSRGFSLYCDRFTLLRRLFPLEQLYRKHILTPSVFPDGEEILAKARDWVENNRARRFFLYLHLMDVHDPYLPPAPYDRMYLGEEFRHLERRQLGRQETIFRTTSPDSALLPLARALYRGGVCYEDRLIGRLLSFLEEGGILDRSLVIITADHGEEFLEHGQTTHGKSLYEEVLRVPLIIRFPSPGLVGAIVEEPVFLLDIAPTVLDAAGAGALQGAEGRSLLALGEGRGGEKDRFRERPRLSELKTHGRLLRAVRERDWKLIMTGGEQAARGIIELYDLAADPGETRDLSRERPDVVEGLLPLLSVIPTGERRESEIPKELKERLEALGYAVDE